LIPKSRFVTITIPEDMEEPLELVYRKRLEEFGGAI
jgi:hypothetical protein